MNTPSAQRLVRAAVELANPDGADSDVTNVLYALTTNSVELLGVDTAGLLLADERPQRHPGSLASSRGPSMS